MTSASGATRRVAIAALAGFALLAGIQGAGAQTGGGYDLSWNTVDGGGFIWSSGGGYTLGGTIGQADAGAMSGGGFALTGGFWAGVPVYRNVFLPVVLRS